MLAGIVIFLRSLLIFLILILLGLDFFFIKTYNSHSTVFLTWRYILQASTALAMLIVYIFCLRLFLNYRQQYITKESRSGDRRRSHVLCAMNQSVVLIIPSIALLVATLSGIFHSYRSVYILGFTRDSFQGKETLSNVDNNMNNNNPKDLWHCPPPKFDDPLSLMCTFDQATIVGGTIIAFFAIGDALLSYAYHDRTTQNPRPNDQV